MKHGEVYSLKRSDILRLVLDRAPAFADRGLALLLQGKELQAQQDFDRCLRINPTMASELKLHIQKATSPVDAERQRKLSSSP